MKHIAKGRQPSELSDWKQGQIDAGLDPTWGDLQNPQKQSCRLMLLHEQGSICCYCNGKITHLGMHIEHYLPRETYKQLELEWNNLLGCCAPKNLKGQKLKGQCHCGEYRGTNPLPVSPLHSNCEAQFRYTFLGIIEPESAENDRASQTIDNLNLNAESLRSRRGALINEAYEAIEGLTEQEWLAVYVERNDDEYPEFAAMCRWFFETHWKAEKEALQSDGTQEAEGVREGS